MSQPDAKEDVAGRKEPSRRQTDDRLLVALNDLDETLSQLTAAVEYAAGRVGGRTSDEVAEYYDDETAEESPTESDSKQILPAGRISAWVSSEGFSLAHLNIHSRSNEGVVRIYPEENFDVTDEWRAFTDEWFGKGKPGSINWGTYGKEDGSKGYYPESYDFPIDDIEEELA